MELNSDRGILQIGNTFRYSKLYHPDERLIDSEINFIYATHSHGRPKIILEKGINTPRKVMDPDGVRRRPAVIISSSPHKAGAKETPWQDFFDTDNGHIRYYGDNKKQGRAPEQTTGNKELLTAFAYHNHPKFEVRKESPPIIFFKRKRRGLVEFHGYGIIHRVDLVTQYNKTQGYFSNYVFHFAVLSLATEHEVFSWDWISDRRNPLLSLNQTLTHAPQSWRNWIKRGHDSIEMYRRRTSKLLTWSVKEQVPTVNSKERLVLNKIYNFYSKEGRRKSQFEALAVRVTERVLGNDYHFKWITPPSGDRGIDFIGHLDVGSGVNKTKLIVLGQAKCEIINKATGGVAIARTVARLKRGWLGVFVTTSYYSGQVQREIIEDKYPIVLINGRRLAEEVNKMRHDGNFGTVEELLLEINGGYENMIQSSDPEEVLQEGYKHKIKPDYRRCKGN